MYESLLREAEQHGVYTYEKTMPPTTKGLYSDNIIWINKHIHSKTEKYCILAEELGHYHTSSGDTLDQTDLSNRKQENRACSWAYEKLFPLSAIVQAHNKHIQNRHDLAIFLGVTEDFLESALKRYQEKYGLFVEVDGYTIIFEPLGVLELFDF